MTLSKILLFTILLSFGLSLQLLDRYPLREDEALYSYWALHLRYEDPWMLTVWPDKPPLYLWSQAALFSFLGATQATARLLNIGITTATVALLAVTSRRLWRDSGTLAAIFYALNPFALSFAATAYTDPLLLFCGQLAFYLTLRGQLFGAGVALGAAIMTKQQGILYFPLLLAVVSMGSLFRPSVTTRINLWVKVRPFVALCLGVAVVVIPLLYGDSLRWHVAPSPWDLSMQNYGGLTFISPIEWWRRAQAWAALFWYVGGSWSAWSLYGLLLLFAVSWGKRIAQHGHSGESCQTGQGAQGIIARLLAVWSLGFLVLHVITSIQIWDRYLLPLIPIVILLLSGAPLQQFVGARCIVPLRMSIHTIVPILCILVLLPISWRAAQGGLPIGGDHGAYSGLQEALAWLRAEEQGTTEHTPIILYQQRLGWQLQFYLYTEERQGQIDVRWFANALTLADNATKSVSHRRFLLQPTWQALPNFALHMATRNLQLIQQRRFGTMMLFEVENSPQQPCDWCLCRVTGQKSRERVAIAETAPWRLLPAAAALSGTIQRCAAGE